MKKIMTIMLAAIMVVAMSATAFADTITKDTATQTALDNAKLKKSEVKNLEADFDDDNNTFEIEFVRKSNRAEYGYEISAKTGKILEKSVEYKYKHTKSRKKIGTVAARKKVAKASGVSYKKIKKGTCKYKYSHKQGVYKIKFKSGGRRYEYEVLAPNGKIIEYDWEVI